MTKNIHSCVVKLNYVSSVLTGVNGDIRDGMSNRALKIAEKDLPGLIKILGIVTDELKKLEDESE